MKSKYKPDQQVYFLICGRYVTKATVVTASSWFVTIRFNKNEGESIIRLPHKRIFATEEEARMHIHQDLPPMQPTTPKAKSGYSCTCRWELWE
jgi:hypothetical protein